MMPFFYLVLRLDQIVASLLMIVRHYYSCASWLLFSIDQDRKPSVKDLTKSTCVETKNFESQMSPTE